MRAPMAAAVLAVVALILVPAPCRAASGLTKIDSDTAARLAAEAIGWTLKNIDYDKQEASFFIFAALGGRYGTAPAAWIGVNQWTGDVWDVWMCRRLSTPALRRSLAAIRRRFAANEMRQYARLHALRPICYGP